MNKYDDLFTPDMSSKQVTLLYFRLCDDVRHNEKMRQELNEAHERARKTAIIRERDAFEKSLNEGYILCTN